MEHIRPTVPAVITTPEAARIIKAFDLDLKVMLSTEQSGGALAALLGWHQPGEGPPDHFHTDRDETFFILEGLYEVTVGERTAEVGRGGLVFIPRNTVHRFRNVGDTIACMLDWTMPGGQDHFFWAIEALAAEGGDFHGEKALAVARRFDTHFATPA